MKLSTAQVKMLSQSLSFMSAFVQIKGAMHDASGRRQEADECQGTRDALDILWHLLRTADRVTIEHDGRIAG